MLRTDKNKVFLILGKNARRQVVLREMFRRS